MMGQVDVTLPTRRGAVHGRCRSNGRIRLTVVTERPIITRPWSDPAPQVVLPDYSAATTTGKEKQLERNCMQVTSETRYRDVDTRSPGHDNSHLTNATPPPDCRRDVEETAGDRSMPPSRHDEDECTGAAGSTGESA